MYLALHHADLRAQLADARLTALRAQLNPHFFFNTLNAVSTLALQGRRDDVAELVERLSDLMRRKSLDEQAQEVALSAELAFADDYLAIQRVRFGDRFHVVKVIGPVTLDAAVPSMVLQPILENAIEYGLTGEEGSTLVTIEAELGVETICSSKYPDTGPGLALGMRKGRRYWSGQHTRAVGGTVREAMRVRVRKQTGRRRVSAHVDSLPLRSGCGSEPDCR